MKAKRKARVWKGWVVEVPGQEGTMVTTERGLPYIWPTRQYARDENDGYTPIRVEIREVLK